MIATALHDISVLHALAGRMRVHLPNWSGQRPRHIERRLRQLPGVKHVEANPLTHNVLIGFDQQQVSQDALLTRLRTLRLELPAEPPEHDESLPPVLRERNSNGVQRARIAVRGIDRDPHFGRRVIEELEKHPHVHAHLIPLTGHVLVEWEPGAPPLAQLVAELAELELPPLPNEERPAHPLDPAPLTHAVVRTSGAVVGLAIIAVRRLTRTPAAPRVLKTATTTSAVIGLLRSFPTLRHGLRHLLGPNLADATFSAATIVSLTAARSPLGLAVMGIEGFVLLRQVLSQRSSWQRYEQHHGIAPEVCPGEAIRLEAGDRVPVRARVLEGTGTALNRDGLPIPVRPEGKLYSGAQLAGGPFVVELEGGPNFTPRDRPTPSASAIESRYLQYLGPASLAYAGLVGLMTRSFAATFNALLLVNPRTALGGTEAANLDAATRVNRAGVVVVGSRPDRVVQRPDLLLIDGTRVLTNGLELSRVLSLREKHAGTELLEIAAGVSAAAGSPWGRAFTHINCAAASAGGFDGSEAWAVVHRRTYRLRPVDDLSIHPEAQHWRDRGEYLLQLLVDDRSEPLVLITVRPKLAPGIPELVQTCQKHGVRLGIVPGGDLAAERALSDRADIAQVVSADVIGIIHKAQNRGALVAFVSDSTDAAEAFADCDLAIGISAGRQVFSARVDLLTPDLLGLAAIIEAGARRDAAVRDAVFFSAASNLFGGVWGALKRPGIERASLPVYLGILSAVSDGLLRLAGGKRPGVSLAYLVDPHPERWGQRSLEEVFRAFNTSATGLTGKQAEERRQRIPRKAQRQELLGAVLDQFRYPTTSILAGAASFSLILGRPFDFTIIVSTIGLNVVVGAWQEQQASRAADALKQMGTATARVVRDHRVQTISARELVPGDVLRLESGDRVAADARLLEAHALEVDEAALTGESFPVIKSPDNGTAENRIVLEGSDVVVGTGSAVVVAVGRQTRMGTMAAALDLDESEQSPLGIRLGQLLWQSLPLTAAASGIVVLAGLVRRQPLGPQLLVGATMALASVPEGLPLLAGLGQGGVARRLAQRNALVRRLAAVEALGRVDIACADKTGTMTEGKLRLSLVADLDSEAQLPGELPEHLAQVLLTAAHASPHPAAAGAAAHPTDVAVVKAADRAGLLTSLRTEREHEEPFDPTHGFHVTVIDGRLCVKGAPEVLLPRCNRVRRQSGEDQTLDDALRSDLAARSRKLAERGLRVLMVAEASAEATKSRDPRDLVTLGFLGIHDPLRPTVKAAVERCQSAGVRVLMITGDHPATARSIARQAGLAVHERAILTGSELTELDDAELAERLEQATVIARATPLDKLRIIESLQRSEHTVAMTGDGVNDAPALRLADVGVAMGQGGTEVARQAADVVLADDDFATLVEAFVEGRGFWQNMRRALGLLLGGNLGELGLIAGSSLLGFPNPLNAPQILVVNLITDALPALAVVLQHPEHRNLAGLAREGISAMDKSLRGEVFRRAMITSGPALTGYFLALKTSSLPQANTVAFASIVGNQLAQTFEAGRYQGHLSRPVLQAVAASAGLLGVTFATPPLRRLLGLALPTPYSLALISAAALSAGWLSRLGTLADANGATPRPQLLLPDLHPQPTPA